MCTVTIVPLIDDLGRRRASRLACNRDEKRTRPEALPPLVRAFGARNAILPIDPVSDGSWIGVNDAGLAATLLNVNLQDTIRAASASSWSRAMDRASRGSIVPTMLACASVDEALGVAHTLDPTRFPPFRLVMLDDFALAELRSDGQQLTEMHDTMGSQPLFFTSSGLGDHLVEEPRRKLFDVMLGAAANPVARQAEFHRHAWPDRSHLSVCMSRPDARTVSHTTVEIEPQRVTLAYLPHAPNEPGEPTTLSLPRRVPSACPC